MNDTDSKKRIRVKRGLKNIKDVGKVVEVDNKLNISVWDDEKCDTFQGTDGTVFAPYFDESGKDDVIAYNPSICRNVAMKFEKKGKHFGIKTLTYRTGVGVDAENNPNDKCYCEPPNDCMKRGVYDLYRCIDAPFYISNPHFYVADPSYLSMVDGLKPDKV